MAIEDEIRDLANWHAEALKRKIDERVDEMQQDDTSHFLIYRVLGVARDEGLLIDVYQNKGRLLYKYAGSFLEQAATLCFKSAFPASGSTWIPNTLGDRKSTRLNSSHVAISYAVFCLKKKKIQHTHITSLVT